MRPLITLLLAIPLFAAPGMRAQTAPAATQGSRPAGKPVATPSAKAPARAAAKKPAKTPAPVAKTVSEKKPAESEQKIARRDPFESLIGRKQAQDALAKNLPPGKAGLQVGTLRLDGIVKAVNGMIAVVANPQQRTYFLREGDQLYDGKVEKISMEGVTFHEEGKDAFGKPVEREVNKRLYSSAGEQQ
jgi:Tfp pilus assembly protein PilP